MVIERGGSDSALDFSPAASEGCVSVRKIQLLAIVIGVLFISPYAESSNKVSYCNPDDISWKKGAMHIDLEKMRVYGDDTSSFIETMKHGDLVGFNIPFPILLFDDSTDRRKLEGDILSGDFKFRFISLESNHRDWWIIIGKPNENIEGIERKTRESAMVLYSLANGILSINLSTDSEWRKSFIVNYVPCDNKTLKYEDIKSVVKGK